MNLNFFHLPVKKRVDEPAKHTLVAFHEPEHYTSEGSEFLDDIIRMKEQPLMIHTEESIAAGSPANLL